MHGLLCVIFKTLNKSFNFTISLGSFNVTKAKLLMADDGPGKKRPAFSFQVAMSLYLDID